MTDAPKPASDVERTLTSHGPPAGPSGSGPRPGQATGSLTTGMKIGKYLVGGLLGRGGMGAVYEATDTALQRKVALKVLPDDVARHEQMFKRFVREARLAARLNHPNAVTVYDVARTKTTCLIAMELVSGSSAQDILDQTGKIAQRQATKMIAAACRALAAAHAGGLIHRDIKPGNILVAADGTVKLSDFGLAKALSAGPGSGEVTLTHKDAVLGTPKYMSPEQCRNAQVDERSDIYSLGATYFSLLTGSAPYVRDTALQMLYAHCTEPTPDPRKLAPDVPELCAHIINKSMAKDPAQRYQSAGEMLADLEQLLAGGESRLTTGRSDFLRAMSALAPGDAAPAGQPVTQTMVLPAPPWYSDKRVQVAIGVGAVLAALLVLVGVLAALLVGKGQHVPPAPPVQAATQPPIAPAPLAPTVTSEPPVIPPPPVEESPATTHAVEPLVVEPVPVDPVEPPQPEQPPVVEEVASTEAPPAEPVVTPPAPTEPAPAPAPAQEARKLHPRVDELRREVAAAADTGDEQAVDQVLHKVMRFYLSFRNSSINTLREAAAQAAELAEEYRPGITSHVPDGPPPGQAPPPHPPDSGRQPPPRRSAPSR